MKCEVIGLIGTTASPEIKITHKDLSITFNAQSFSRNSFKQGFDVFSQINQLWESNVFTESEIDQIFRLYSDINMLFSTVWRRDELIKSVTDKTTQLLDLHNFEKIYDWVLMKSDCVIPDKFEREYIHSVDNRGTREQTYIRSDYTKLITMALIFRAMIPVWGQFIFQTRQESGTTYKEYHAFHLIKNAKIRSSEPFEKLQVFIDRTIGDDRNSMIIDGVGSEEFVTWITSLVFLRRLCVGDIRGLDPKANIVTYIHRFVFQRMRSSDTPAENMVKEKAYNDSGTDIEAKLSSLERYKIKHDIAIGDIDELDFIMGNLYPIAYRLSGNMTDDLFYACLNSAQQLNNQRILDPQINIMRWIFKSVISPKGLMYLEKNVLVNAIGVTQAVLWARKHHYLAMLVSSYVNMVEGEVHLSGTDSRQRVSKEDQALIDQLYPYTKIVGGKKTGQRPINLAMKSIDNMTDDLSKFTWTMTADNIFIEQTFGHAISKRIHIPSDIRIKLAKLVIELGQRNWQ